MTGEAVRPGKVWVRTGFYATCRKYARKAEGLGFRWRRGRFRRLNSTLDDAKTLVQGPTILGNSPNLLASFEERSHALELGGIKQTPVAQILVMCQVLQGGRSLGFPKTATYLQRGKKAQEDEEQHPHHKENRFQVEGASWPYRTEDNRKALPSRETDRGGRHGRLPLPDPAPFCRGFSARSAAIIAALVGT